MENVEKPETVVSGREKWTAKVGQISQGRPNIPVGAKYYMAYQKAAGSRKHSGPSGKRASRWYAGRIKKK